MRAYKKFFFYLFKGHGGDSANANAYMAEMGITDETCSIYRL